MYHCCAHSHPDELFHIWTERANSFQTSAPPAPSAVPLSRTTTTTTSKMALLDTLPLANPSYLWLSLAALLLAPLLTLLHDLRLQRRMPPGPPPLPFLGTSHLLPRSQPWHQFLAWSRTYGPIFTLWSGRSPTVVISDPCVAAELLERRSAKYSSRPRMVAMGELLWDGGSVLVQPYGKQWLARRRLLHQALTPKALRGYQRAQEAEAARLCAQVLDGPRDDWVRLVERFTASVVFAVAYGRRIDSLDAAVIRERFAFMQYSAGLNVPGRYLVESVPWLKHVPACLAPWKRDIVEHGRAEAAANMRLVDVVKADVARAEKEGRSAPDSLCKLLLELRASGKDATGGCRLSDRDFAFVPASLFGAGSDTTASTICSALLALVTHPHVLRTAHAELDAVVGADRTPGFADEARLPYLRAFVKEVLRWRPVAVLGGTPHATTEDDVYDGWFIPAGTTVLGNSWAINLNEAYYPDPHRFEPARFLADDEAAELEGATSGTTGGLGEQVARARAELRGGRPHPSKLGHSSFGWGRRICPGADLATNSLVAALGKLLWAFDILPKDGVVYDALAYTDGFNIRPRPFECVIRPRSERHAAVVRSEAAGPAMEVLARFEPFGE